MTTVLIEIRGGLLEAVTATEDIEYILIDYDNLDGDKKIEEDVQLYSPDGILTKEQLCKEYLTAAKHNNEIYRACNGETE
jgi:hypothetical protein